MTDIIDNIWLKKRLAEQRGLRTRLAEFMGLHPSVISKITAGTRQIKGLEVQQIQDFFNEFDRSKDQLGFSEKVVSLKRPVGDDDMISVATRNALASLGDYKSGPSKPESDVAPGNSQPYVLRIEGSRLQLAGDVDANDLLDLIHDLELAAKMLNRRSK